MNTNLYYVKGKRKRTIFTLFENIIIERRIYLDRATKRCVILFDKFIGLEPWTYIQKCFYHFFTKAVNSVTSY
ncbi:UPF0236 family transposase-like protein [Candidatus Mycoplasma mahonii]|uniref:UPF0236 family transposase-like protein n=1 Tax=Candidatus Mycoplasma mahonii TaxID=3004105 RepID=UPI003570D72A